MFCCVKCINEGNYMFLLVPCDQQHATNHSLRNTGLYLVPFLWCYILVVKISRSCKPFQNDALKAADCCVCLNELTTIDSSMLHVHLLSFLVRVPQNKVMHVTCVRQHSSISCLHPGPESGFQFLAGTNQSTESG